MCRGTCIEYHCYKNLTYFTEFPWMAAVLHQEVVNGTLAIVYTCGGSLIAKNVILTGMKIL